MSDSVRKFKAVNVLGLDFYVDWLENDGTFEKIIAVKDVHGGRNFVYKGLLKDNIPVETLLLNACGVTLKEKKEEIKQEQPAAQETEQPKEKTYAKKTKRSIKQD